MIKAIHLRNLFVFLLSALLITACGGGGGGSSSSTTGTAITARGVITGFGSVYVNGVRYDSSSSSVSIDDNPGLESDLKLGMVVTVQGSRNDDNTGTASSIEFDDEVQGPISSIVTSPDGTIKTLTVLGITVLVDQGSTSIHDTTFDALAVDDLVEVSGFYDGSLVLNATFLELKSTFTPGVSEVELKGTVQNNGATSFEINGIVVNYDPTGTTTDLSRLTTPLADGQFVEVKGTLDAGGEITATRIATEDDGFDDNMDKVSIEGIITDYVDDSDFLLNGIPVDASSANISPTSLVLANGVKIEAEGPIVNGTLEALTIEARGGDDIKIEARISALSSADDSITLDLVTGSVTVFIDIRTRMEDKTGSSSTITFADLALGDFVEVQGQLDDTSRVVLSELRRDDVDDVILQGPVESFSSGSSVTILGVTLTTTGATQFEDVNDLSISSADFYNSLAVGSLVKIKDNQPGDGTADEVEFED